MRDIYNLIECCHYHSQYIDKVGEKWFNFWQGKGKYMHFQNLATTRFLSDFRWISKKKKYIMYIFKMIKKLESYAKVKTPTSHFCNITQQMIKYDR